MMNTRSASYSVAERVARHAARVLQLPEADLDRSENLFHQGLDSLNAIRLIHALNREFSIELPLQDLFYHPTVAGFSEIIESSLRELAPLAAALEEAETQEH